MVWKCPPLHLPNWNSAWKWKKELTDEDSIRHRDEQPTQPDMDVRDEKHRD